MYVHGAPKYRKKIQRVEAELVLKDYAQLRQDVLTEAERKFVSGAGEVAVLYCNEILRKNQTLDRDIKAAEKERVQHEQRIDAAEVRNIWVRGLVRYAPMGVVAALCGALLARIIGITLPEEWAQATGKGMPQIVAAIGLFVLSTYITRWWNERTEARFDNHYNSRVLKAIELFELGRDLAIAKYTNDATTLWAEYTRKSIPKEWASYRTIIKEEIRAAQILRRKRRELETTELQRLLLGPVRAWSRWRKRRNYKKNGALAPKAKQSSEAVSP